MDVQLNDITGVHIYTHIYDSVVK